MLVMSREIGQALVIEDVVVTLDAFDDQHADITLQKVAGGKSISLTLNLNEFVDACYDTRIVLIATRDTKARLGIEAPKNVPIHRKEIWDQL